MLSAMDWPLRTGMAHDIGLATAYAGCTYCHHLPVTVALESFGVLKGFGVWLGTSIAVA